jgi:hypothetical protein
MPCGEIDDISSLAEKHWARPVFDDDVLPLRIAPLAQCLPKGVAIACCSAESRAPVARNRTIGIDACCARAASGKAVAAPPSSVMNSRRFRSPRRRGRAKSAAPRGESALAF